MECASYKSIGNTPWVTRSPVWNGQAGMPSLPSSCGGREGAAEVAARGSTAPHQRGRAEITKLFFLDLRYETASRLAPRMQAANLVKIDASRS